MDCQICYKEVKDNGHYIKGKYYHNDCIEKYCRVDGCIEEDLEMALKSNNALNKGIDELLKKYEDYIRYWENEIYKNPILIIEYKQFIRDLKSLKGE